MVHRKYEFAIGELVPVGAAADFIGGIVQSLAETTRCPESEIVAVDVAVNERRPLTVEDGDQAPEERNTFVFKPCATAI